MAIGASSLDTFRTHIKDTPLQLDPKLLKQSGGAIVFQSLACPLNQVADCQFKNKKTITCLIKSQARFEDGQSILPQDFISAFQRFIDPTPPAAYQANLLFAIKNAKNIYYNQAPISTLGIRVGSKSNELVIELEKSFPEFVDILSNPLLTAYRIPKDPKTQNPSLISCGPFKIKSWVAHKKIILQTNTHFPYPKNHQPLNIEFNVISDDNFVLQSFEDNKIDWVRQLPVHLIPKFKQNPNFKTQDQIRLDSLFFNTQDPLFSWAPILAQSIDYEAWGKVFSAKPRPGCFGLPTEWTGQPVCYQFDPNKAHQFSQKLTWPIQPTLLFYSKSGSTDHNRSMEFLQTQWELHLKKKILLEPLEGKVFIDRVNQGQLNFFRKGISPERASCLAILELFARDPSLSPGQPTQWRSQFQKNLLKMSELPPQSPKYQAHCLKNLLQLQNDLRLIPTGPIYFSYLLKPHWQGLKLDALNRTDFTQLKLLK